MLIIYHAILVGGVININDMPFASIDNIFATFFQSLPCNGFSPSSPFKLFWPYHYTIFINSVSHAVELDVCGLIYIVVSVQILMVNVLPLASEFVCVDVWYRILTSPLELFQCSYTYQFVIILQEIKIPSQHAEKVTRCHVLRDSMQHIPNSGYNIRIQRPFAEVIYIILPSSVA